MNKNQNETATQLFARLIANKQTNNEQAASQTTPKSTTLTQIENILMINRRLNIDKRIFANGIENKQIIEILARSTFGKTELVMHMISRLILSNKWSFEMNNQTFTLNLSDQSCLDDQSQIKVILIETESKFSILRLFTILENRLTEAYNNNLDSLPKFTNQTQSLMNKFIKDCLKNLIIYKCDSNEQFILALSACDHYIQILNQSKQIVPIFIDTINANYELLDKYNQHLGLSEANFTENYAVILVKRLIEKYNICIVATRSEFINPDLSKTFLDYFYNSFQKWQQLVTKRIELTQCAAGSTGKYLKLTELDFKNENNRNNNLILDKLFYSIQNNGFTFFKI